MVVVVNELFVGVVDRIVVVYVVVGYASNCDKFYPSFLVCFCSETHRERKILRASSMIRQLRLTPSTLRGQTTNLYLAKHYYRSLLYLLLNNNRRI